MKRIAIYIALTVLLVACGSKQEPQPQEPSPRELHMQALYGENKSIEGEYNDSLAVDVTNGVFVGQRDGSLLYFLGIPYALQPTGDLRWKVAKSEPDSYLVREARYYGHSSLQPHNPEVGGSLYKQGEDCLYLNVWTAEEGMRQGGHRPVMVWFHGGSYVSGATSDPEYNAADFVKAHPEVVFVTVNYRLGLLGFLDLSLFPDGKDYERSGNLGILDQVEALRWVKRNIAAFGGDPNNVTIFGHSAGAGSVSVLMCIDEAQGLFQRAIAQSGSLCLTSSKEDCLRLTKRVKDETGAKTVADLVALDEEQISNLAVKLSAFNRFPERDSIVLPLDPYARLDGFTSRIDFLTGTVKDETRSWISTMGGVDKFHMAIEAWQHYIQMGLDSTLNHQVDKYMASTSGERVWRVTEFFNDLMFRGPAIEMAQRHATSGGRTYMYYWTKSSGDAERGADHFVEVPYLFGHQENGDSLTREMQQMWVNFAATGNPSTPAHYWPTYDTLRRATMVLGDTIKVVDDPLGEHRQLIVPLVGKYISPIYIDLLDNAPWYLGCAVGALIAAILLIIWIIVKIRRLFKRK